MPLREQEEGKSRKKKIAKRGSVVVDKQKNLVLQPTQQIGFDKFFLLVNGWEKIIIAAALSFFLCIPVLRYFSENSTLIIVTLVTTIMLVFPVFVYLYVSTYYKSYLRLVHTGLHSISGWSNVIGSLSADFWKGKTFAAIKIEVRPGTTALADERNRLAEFLSTFANEGSRILPHITLTHFTLDVQFRVGKQSAFVIRKIFSELVAMMSKNRAEHAVIELSLSGETR
jgi:hypothetical protein